MENLSVHMIVYSICMLYAPAHISHEYIKLHEVEIVDLKIGLFYLETLPFKIYKMI